MKNVESRPARGERIVQLAMNKAYVFCDESVHSVSEQLSVDSVPAVAVVDHELHLQGIVVAKELFSVLGKPFGRDLLSRKAISIVSERAETFLFTEQIQDVEARIAPRLSSDENQYFCLVDSTGEFCGIFSSKDMLVYSASLQKRDMTLAGSIQGRIVPRYKHFPGEFCEFVATAIMAQSVGGDYYHVVEFEPGKWFFCLCDISGKGIAAALITAVLEGFMCTADFRRPLDEIVSQLNTLILAAFALEKYLTGIFCVFDSENGHITFCDMGHGLMYVWHLGENGKSVFMPVAETAENMPVGIMEDVPITMKNMVLAESDVLVLFTDGLSEQENAAGNVFDVQVVSECLDSAFRTRGTSSDSPLKRAKIGVLEEFHLFRDETVQHDDTSLLMLRRISRNEAYTIDSNNTQEKECQEKRS